MKSASPFDASPSDVDLFAIFDTCAGYVRRVTHDEIADTIG